MMAIHHPLSLALLASIAINTTTAQELVWVKQLSGPFSVDSRSIAVDATGHVHVAGRFDVTVDFDPGPGTFELTSAGGADAFAIKLNASGDLVWARQLGNGGNTRCYAMALDAGGNLYLTGEFTGTGDFDPGPGTMMLTSNTTSQPDVFICKLNASGDLVWARSFGGPTLERGVSIAVDGNGNVYTTGFFSGTVDFDPGPGTLNLTSAGNEDIFISKLDASGDLVWAVRMGGSNWDYGASIAVDGSGNVYTTGAFRGTVDFDPGPDFFLLTSNTVGEHDVFVSKLDGEGQFVWAKRFGGPGGDTGDNIALDANGQLYISGGFSGAVDFDPGAGTYILNAYDLHPTGNAAFISKLDVMGDFAWARPLLAGVSHLAADGDGRVFSTGAFSGAVDLDPGPGIFNVTSAGNSDIFICAWDASGIFVWAASMGGPGADAGGAIAVDGSGQVYTTGSFFSTADFDPGPGVLNLTSAGFADAFIHKMTGPFTGVDEYVSTDMLVYPNPARDRLTIRLGTASVAELRSVTGVLMDSFPARQLHSIDVSSYPAGIYFAKAGSVTMKCLVVR